MISAIKFIVYECNHSGHRVDYLSYLIEYTIKYEILKQTTLFVLGSDLISKLKIAGCKIDLINHHSLENIYEENPKRAYFLLNDIEAIVQAHTFYY